MAKDTIKAAETAAKSTTAMDALASGQLNLVEAAAITEFEDLPGALDRLLNAAGTRRFEHTVAQLREERAEAEAKAAQGWTERGFTVLPQQPQSWDEACIPLRYLVSFPHRALSVARPSLKDKDPAPACAGRGLAER